MGKAWIRKEIKKDKVVNSVEAATRWARKNPQKAWGAGLGAGVVILLAVYFAVRFQDVRTSAWNQLAAGQNLLRRSKPAEAVKLIGQVHSLYSNTPAAGFAALLHGDLMYYGGNFNEAGGFYKKVIDAGRPRLVPFALSDMGFALQAAGKHAEAAGRFQEFLDRYGDHFLAPQIHSALARSREALGEKDQAKAAYEKILILYPDTAWAAEAQARIKPSPKNNESRAPAPREPKAAQTRGRAG